MKDLYAFLFFKVIFAILLFTALMGSLKAQEQQDTIPMVFEMSEVVVSAVRSETKAANLPVTVGITSRNEIENFQPLTPVEALQYQAGVVRQSDGGLASTPIIRGLSRERAPVLVDGNPFVGGRIRTYSLIDPYQIERMEVVKGPASAFWGSDAVGGLVNVITRRAESGYGKDFKLGGSLYGGFQSVNNLLRGRAELEGRGNGLDFLVGVGARDAGNTKTPEGEVENSQFETFNADFNIGYSPAANHRIELSGKYFRNDNVGFPGGLGAPGPPRVIRQFMPDQQTDINLAYDGKALSDKVAAIGVRLFYKEQDLHIDQVTNVFFEGTQNVNRRIHAMLDVDVPFMGGRFFTTFNLGERSKLTAGIDYLREHRIGTHRDLNVRIFNPMGMIVNEINRPYTQIQPDSYYNGIGVFAVQELQLSEKFNFLLALRYDNVNTRIEDGPFDIPSIGEIFDEENFEDNDNALTGNFGVKYHATEGFSFTANVANSFRAADLFSKYHFTAVGQGFLVPNPELDPERGVFYELGAQFNNRKILAGLNFYQNFLNDLFVRQNIEFDDTPSVQWQNVGEATITGVEWNVSAKIGALSQIFLTGTYTSGKNEITGDPLPEIPALQNIVGIQIRERNNKFFAQADAIIVSEQNDPAPNEIETPGYVLINLNGGINLHELIRNIPSMKLLLGVTNLTDEAYRSHISRGAPGNQNVFLNPGISLNVGFVTRFGVAAEH